MPDFYFTEDGDILPDSTGDIALTPNEWRNFGQQALIRIMTDIGDYILYPQMGCNLSSLIGQPQSPQTAQLGIQLINSGLNRENYFTSSQITVTGVPSGPQSQKFTITISIGSIQSIQLAIQQNLSFT